MCHTKETNSFEQSSTRGRMATAVLCFRKIDDAYLLKHYNVKHIKMMTAPETLPGLSHFSADP